MDIRFISSLNAEDENRLASILLAAVTNLLDQFPLAYAIRIETASGQLVQHSHPASGEPVAISGIAFSGRS